MMENLFTLAGRLLLAAYFFLPGAMKLADFEGTSGYMAAHGMVLIPVFLSLTIVMQIAGAVLLAVGYRVRLTAFLLAGLVLVISCVMHDFWNITDALQQQHETQNFMKNMAIMAGLMVLAGGNGAASTRALVTGRA
jgi:putative oxidoreductase